MTGLRYVYAVCRPLDAPLQVDLTGVAGDPPRLLTHHGLVAVVSHVPERDFAEEPLHRRLADPDWWTATSRAHQQVVDALTAVTTPLPLRVATVFRDDSGVRVMMERREDDFRDTLERLAGRVEWGVRVYATEAGGAGEAGARFAGRLHTALAARAERSRVHEETAGGDLLRAAYLVPRTRSEEFVETVERAKDEAAGMEETGTAVELTGPWAAYSFVDPDVELRSTEPEGTV